MLPIASRWVTANVRKKARPQLDVLIREQVGESLDHMSRPGLVSVPVAGDQDAFWRRRSRPAAGHMSPT